MPDLKCFESMRVTNLRVGERRITADYELTLENGDTLTYKLIHGYEEDVSTDKTQEFAGLMVSVPLVNYGLFADKLVFDVPLTRLDQEYLVEMAKNTARDIFVNRILKRTGFVKEEYIPNEATVTTKDAEPRAEFIFTKTVEPGPPIEGLDEWKCAVMSSGGKESLLSYGVLREIGCEVYPSFLNESGHHWFTALTAYRYFKEHEPRTMRVWTNVDRLFTFIERNMKILDGKALRRRRAEVYPIRLFFFEHYIFSFLPLFYKRRVAHIVLGNEYDDPSQASYEYRGIRHYNAVYDQSQEFDKYMTAWFARRGFAFKQWSVVRPLSGLIVERILAYRYPELFKLQRSCHSVHLEDGVIVPCGRCFKCNGILLFLQANGIDPTIIGYKRRHAATVLDRVKRGMVRLDEDELEHSLYLISLRRGVKVGGEAWHDHVEMLQFDDRNSHLDDIPILFREKVYKIYEEYTRGYAYLTRKGWARITREEALRGELAGDPGERVQDILS